MNEEELLSEIKKSPFLLGYFSYDECQVCKVLKPRVQDLLKDFPEIQYLYVDTDSHPLLKGQYLVFSVPTIIIFQEGRELKRFGRYISLSLLEEYIQQITVKK